MNGPQKWLGRWTGTRSMNLDRLPPHQLPTWERLAWTGQAWVKSVHWVRQRFMTLRIWRHGAARRMLATPDSLVGHLYWVSWWHLHPRSWRILCVSTTILIRNLEWEGIIRYKWHKKKAKISRAVEPMLIHHLSRDKNKNKTPKHPNGFPSAALPLLPAALLSLLPAVALEASVAPSVCAELGPSASLDEILAALGVSFLSFWRSEVFVDFVASFWEVPTVLVVSLVLPCLVCFLVVASSSGAFPFVVSLDRFGDVDAISLSSVCSSAPPVSLRVLLLTCLLLCGVPSLSSSPGCLTVFVVPSAGAGAGAGAAAGAGTGTAENLAAGFEFSAWRVRTVGDSIPPKRWPGGHPNRLRIRFNKPTNPYLVGGFNPSGKYEFVSWDDDSQYMEKQSKWSKPPTSYGLVFGGC